jgi:hypothetical protein
MRLEVVLLTTSESLLGRALGQMPCGEYWSYTAGANRPCNSQNHGKSKNFFHGGKPTLSSLEEFPMAFMEEGGITDIEDTIGKTHIRENVKRSTTLRCIEVRESKAKRP